MEKGVQTMENSLPKTADEGLYVVLLGYRIQPEKDMASAGQLVIVRKFRSFVSLHAEQLKQ